MAWLSVLIASVGSAPPGPGVRRRRGGGAMMTGVSWRIRPFAAAA